MVLVDSSVLIDRLHGLHNPKADIFDKVIERGIPFGISVFTYQEVLQGARGEQKYRHLRDELSRRSIFFPSPGLGTYEHAARLFSSSAVGRVLRRIA